MVKRILFTAPVSYHNRLREAISMSPVSFSPLFVPLIRTSVLPPDGAFLEFCRCLTSFDYIVCPSLTAVRALASSDLSRTNFEGRVVAIGRDQLSVTRLLGVEPVLRYAKPSMMGIVEALQLQSSPSAKHVAVLLPQFSGLPVPTTITDFLSALRLMGVAVTPVYCYRTSTIDKECCTDLADALCHGFVDAIAITSGGEAYVLSRILSLAAAQGQPVEVPIYSFGPYTTRCAQEVALDVAGTSPCHHSFTDYVEYLASVV